MERDMMPTNVPALRPGLKFVAGDQPGTVVIVDQYRLGGPLQLSLAAFDVIRLFDGERTLEEIRVKSATLFEGSPVPNDVLLNLLTGLDQELFLDTPRLHERLRISDRPPSCIGCYDADPDKARRQINRLFTASGGAGLPGKSGCRVAEAGPVKAVLLPHMDYARGGVTYGWGLKELVERTEAKLFVVIATSHYSGKRFTLTRQNFTSPFGRVETDQKYIDRIVSAYGDGLFDDPYAHVPEHSIELEVVAMQSLLQGQRDFRIVPLLVGSFFDCIHHSVRPNSRSDISRMIAALRQAEAAAGEPVCYVISGDLAHIGPKFDDEDLVSAPQLEQSLKQDERLLAKVADVDVDGYYDVIAAERDERRICGLPPTYVALQAARPSRGSLLHYGRFVHPEGFESVSFASAAFV